MGSGTLEVTSGGTDVADIELAGSYKTSNFVFTPGAGNTVKITDPSGSIAGGAVTTLASAANSGPSLTGFTGPSNIALLGTYMASLFASTEGQVGTPISATTQALHSLASPHHA